MSESKLGRGRGGQNDSENTTTSQMQSEQHKSVAFNGNANIGAVTSFGTQTGQKGTKYRQANRIIDFEWGKKRCLVDKVIGL